MTALRWSVGFIFASGFVCVVDERYPVRRLLIRTQTFERHGHIEHCLNGLDRMRFSDKVGLRQVCHRVRRRRYDGLAREDERMSLSVCTDVSASDWLVRQDMPFRGALTEWNDWGRDVQFDPRGASDAYPAFLWPADHSWCVANDVDPDFAVIGGPAAAIELLIADPRIDAVTVAPYTPSDPDRYY